MQCCGISYWVTAIFNNELDNFEGQVRIGNAFFPYKPAAGQQYRIKATRDPDQFLLAQ